jgi:prepilin-type N-terminal cleavage/methylation domain-containing protein/prepilin-type processing-associated H-X9-DG protein
MKKAFTLLELLVVILIIAILAAITITNLDQVRESAWSRRCTGNLRSLYQAACNYTIDNGNYPRAAPSEITNGIAPNLIYVYWPGWVTWVIDGTPATNPATLWSTTPSPTTPQQPKCSGPTFYGTKGRYAIQFGSLWEYTGKCMQNYLCPKFARYAVCGVNDPVRSYVMNYNVSVTKPTDMPYEPSRTVLFAEMQPGGAEWQTYCPGSPKTKVCAAYPTPAAGGVSPGSFPAQNDGKLDYPLSGGVPYETIGFTHRMSGEFRGHAVFCDGHVEAIGLGAGSTNRTVDACTGQF